MILFQIDNYRNEKVNRTDVYHHYCFYNNMAYIIQKRMLC